MKRYYIIPTSEWPHPMPDADGNVADVPFLESVDGEQIDPRLRLGEAHTIHLWSLGGPADMMLVVVMDPSARPPESWDALQIPHLLSGRTLTEDQVSALACLGVQPGDTAYTMAKNPRVVAECKHFHPHWIPQ